ncbi:MFS transporter [Nocardia mexicana]|nr:MFS transporter [Nocardia mexicana]
MPTRTTTAPPDAPTHTPAAFFLTAAALCALIAGTEIPTPLYVLYRGRFGLSDTMLTVIFAVYALALIPALLVGGRLADRFGRRRLVLFGLVLAALGAGTLAAATGTGWLLAGRAVQGVAVGAATGAATAALVELDALSCAASAGLEGEGHAPDRHHRAALFATSAVAVGGAAGPLLGGLAAQYLSAPFALSYLVESGLLLVLALGLAAVGAWPVSPAGETAAGLPGAPAGPQTAARRPGIPADIRIPFARIGITVFAAWSVGALYTSVVPSYAVELLGTRNLAILGAVAFAMLATAAATQLTLRSIRPRLAQTAGLLLLAAGLAALVLAFPARSAAWLGTSAMLDGIGLGLAFLGAQSELNRIAPPHRRAELAAAFNVCLYCGVAFPVIGVGLLADAGSLFAAVTVFAAGIGGLAVAAAVWAARR